MLREKISRISKNKYFDVALISIINVIFFIICNCLFTPKYEQVDDFIIMNLISKSDGNYSLYGVQMHPVICAFIILLYKTTININWYTVFLLVMQFISFTIIGTVFMKKNRSIGLFMHIVLIFTMYLKTLCYIQYTHIAMTCITSGFVLLIYTLEDVNINRFKFVSSLIMIVIGCMIRFSTILIAIPFIVIYAIYKILKDKCVKKVLFISMILAVVILLVNITFNIFYNINPIYKQFLEFHDARTYLHDYNYLYYDGNEEVFATANWSENDREIFYRYCFGNEEFFSTESLEKLGEIAKKNNTFTLETYYNTLEYFYLFATHTVFGFPILLTILLVLYNNIYYYKLKTELNSKNRIIELTFINLSFLTCIFIHFLFIFLDRALFRVVISVYIIEILILMYTFLKNIKNPSIKNPIIKELSIIFLLTVCIVDLQKNVFEAKKYKLEDYSVYKEVLEYTNTHKENAYLYTLSMKDRYLAYSIYEKVPDNVFSNVRPLGDWDTYTQNYYDFKERYHTDNLIESLYLKDNVYLISGDVIWEEEYEEYIHIIVKYIKEHYNIDVKTNIIKEFDKNIKIYKLTH